MSPSLGKGRAPTTTETPLQLPMERLVFRPASELPALMAQRDSTTSAAIKKMTPFSQGTLI